MTKYKSCNTYDVLEAKLKTYITENEDLELIKKAYDYAYDKHFGQKRLTGEEYITHPLSVAYILTSINADATTIAAAILHDIFYMGNADIDDFRDIF